MRSAQKVCKILL